MVEIIGRKIKIMINFIIIESFFRMILYILNRLEEGNVSVRGIYVLYI